jgi:hypothetical protein
MVTIKRKIVTEIEWKVSTDELSWNAFDAWMVIAKPKAFDRHEFENFVRENIRHIVNMSYITRRIGFSYEDIVGDYDEELISVAMENNDYFFKKKFIENWGVADRYEYMILKEFGRQPQSEFQP